MSKSNPEYAGSRNLSVREYLLTWVAAPMVVSSLMVWAMYAVTG